MAGDTAPRSGLALTVQTELDALVGAGRDIDGDGLLGPYDTTPLTLDTRVRDDLAFAVAAVAQRHIDELPENRLLHAPDLATAFAARALRALAAGLHAATGAARAARMLGQADLFGRAEDGFFERQVHVVTQVLTALH